ncbi:MAG: hypothetical protein ACREA3_09995 [Nitrosotalea sp.]
MKTLHLSFIMFTIIILLSFGLQPARADNVNGIYIQNIEVQPSTIKVGDTFTVTTTLINNSTVPITLEGGKCSIKDTQASFFTVMFDNQTKIKTKDIYCAGVGWDQILDPGKSITGSSSDYPDTYVATESGTANVTASFSYYVKNQTDPTQPDIRQTISKSLLFTILDNNTGSSVKLEKVLLSPLKQFKSGVEASKVVCNRGFQLILKREDGLPACVRPDTLPRLIAQNWAKITPEYLGIKELTVDQIESNYTAGDKINFDIKFKGIGFPCDYPHVIVTNSDNKPVWKSNNLVVLCDPATTRTQMNQDWLLSSGYGGPIIINQTGTYHLTVAFEDRIVRDQFTINPVVPEGNSSNKQVILMRGIGLQVVTPYSFLENGGRSAVIIDVPIKQVNVTRGNTATVDVHIKHLAGKNPFPFVYAMLTPPFNNIWYPPSIANSTTQEERIHATETGNLISGSIDLGTLITFSETKPIKIKAGSEQIIKMYITVPQNLGEEFVGQGVNLNIPIKVTDNDGNSNTVIGQDGNVNFFIVD